MTLYEMSEGAKALYEMFYSGDIDEETLNDTIESFGVEDKLEDYCKLIRQFTTDIEALKLEEARLSKKRERAEKTVERLKGNILFFFDSTGKEKENAGIFTVAVRKSEQVKIIDSDKIPSEYKKIKMEISPDKSGIKAAIKLGKHIDGAEIQINKSINIK